MNNQPQTTQTKDIGMPVNGIFAGLTPELLEKTRKIIAVQYQASRK